MFALQYNQYHQMRPCIPRCNPLQKQPEIVQKFLNVISALSTHTRHNDDNAHPQLLLLATIVLCYHTIPAFYFQNIVKAIPESTIIQAKKLSAQNSKSEFQNFGIRTFYFQQCKWHLTCLPQCHCYLYLLCSLFPFVGQNQCETF